MKAIITAAVCPLLLHPSPDAELADEALLGMTVEVLCRPRPGWFRVRTHYRYEGYAPAGCLLLGDGSAARWAALPKGVVTRGYCTVLGEPRVQSTTLMGLTRGAVVALCGATREDGWQAVTLPDGRNGYTRSSCLGKYYEIAPEIALSALRERIVETALSYLGTHYRWGGKTPLGMDCSGLTSMAYLLNGVVIFRDARIAEGFPVREIALEDAQPADLLFFPGHTALWLGQGRFVHATAQSGSDGVVINSLNPGDPDYRADLAQSLAAVGSAFSRETPL